MFWNDEHLQCNNTCSRLNVECILGLRSSFVRTEKAKHETQMKNKVGMYELKAGTSFFVFTFLIFVHISICL